MDLSIQSYWEIPDRVDSDPESESHGDRATVLREYLTANYDRLYRRLLRHFGCPDQASDCLHDAWLRLGEMEVSANVNYPEAYVYRVACNLALDSLRGRRSWQSLADVEDLDAVVDLAPGPDQIAEARSELAAVESAMQRLPRRHQSVLLELRVNEWTRQEVADRHGLSLRRVDTVLRQALAYCAEKTRHQVASRSRTQLPPQLPHQ